MRAWLSLVGMPQRQAAAAHTTTAAMAAHRAMPVRWGSP